MITLDNVSLRYGDRLVLRRVSLQARDGEITAVLGPSGSGKSTILKLMLGLIKPTSGRVIVKNTDITGLTEEHLFPIRKSMGMVFQGNALFDSLNVVDNLAFFLRENMRLAEPEINERVREQLRFAGLEGFERQLPDALSGGMRKRLAIGRALIFGPQVVLLDEPTAGLDPISTRRVLDVVRNLRDEKGIGAVMVTHIISDVFNLADRVVVLYQGEVVFSGTPNEMYDSNHPFVESFLKEPEEMM